MSQVSTQIQHALDDNFSLVALKCLVILLGVVIIVLALCINNKLALAGVGAWVLFP